MSSPRAFGPRIETRRRSRRASSNSLSRSLTQDYSLSSVLLSSYGRGESILTTHVLGNEIDHVGLQVVLDDEDDEDDENGADVETLEDEQHLDENSHMHYGSTDDANTSAVTTLITPQSQHNTREEDLTFTGEKTSFKSEFIAISLNSFPLIITFFLQNSLSVASIMSIGHLGSVELAGITLGSMTANVTSFSIISGVSTCLDTLCSQLYGAGKHHLISLYFQRCNAVLFLIIIPIIVLYFLFGYKALFWITNDELTSDYLLLYLKTISLGLPGYCLFETGKRFLQCQGVFHLSTYVLFVCAPLNALLNYVLVWNSYIGVGYLGAPLLVLITYWLMPLGLLIYTVKFDSSLLNCWKVYSVRKVFTNLSTLLHLALPSLIMIELEFLLFEFMTIFASKLSILELLLQSCVASISALSWQLIFAISVALSTRVLNYLGAGLIDASRICCQISFWFAILVSLLNCLILLIFSKQISLVFTSDPAILKIVAGVMPTLLCFQFVDSLNSVGAGCLRGQGLQKIGSVLNLVSYYGLGLPLSYYLTFTGHLGLNGLWLGTSCLLLINSVVEFWYIFYSDWDHLYEQLKLRNNESLIV